VKRLTDCFDHPSPAFQLLVFVGMHDAAVLTSRQLFRVVTDALSRDGNVCRKELSFFFAGLFLLSSDRGTGLRLWTHLNFNRSEHCAQQIQKRPVGFTIPCANDWAPTGQYRKMMV
jgi:hypothetical protein